MFSLQDEHDDDYDKYGDDGDEYGDDGDEYGDDGDDDDAWNKICAHLLIFSTSSRCRESSTSSS